MQNLTKNKTTIFYLLTKLQQQIWKRNRAFYWPHSGSFWTAQTFKCLKWSGRFANQGHSGLCFWRSPSLSLTPSSKCYCIKISVSDSSRICSKIVRSCLHCPTTANNLPMAVNPRGLRPNILWQMDVTHVSSFRKLSFVHVTVDTFSHVIIATARTGEAYKDVVQHLFLLFIFRPTKSFKNW